MTMVSMDQYLENRGFNVKRKYDPSIRKYKFTISKDDCTLSMPFEYPATGDVAVRDKKQREFLEEMIARFKRDFEDDKSLYPKTMVAFMEVPNWRDPDRYLSIEDMREVLRQNGMSVEIRDLRNDTGKNETWFWMYRNGRTLRRVLYEYDIGGIENIQRHRKYFLDEIIKAFETAEAEEIKKAFKENEKKENFVHFMGVAEMIAQLEVRGFKAESDYDARRKIYFIHARKGVWHIVREVEYFDILLRSQEDIDNQARKRQDTLESIFEAYEKYEKENKNKMGNNIEWKVDNLTIDRRFGEQDTFKVELHGRMNGVVCGDIVDISNRLQKKLNEPDRNDSMDAWTYVMAGGRQNGKTLMQFKMYAKMLGIDLGSKLPAITKVIFNNPATIVIWADDTKTVVKAQNDELFDPEKGLAMAITKKALGNEGNYFDVIKKHVTEYQDSVTVKKLTVDICVDNAFKKAADNIKKFADSLIEKKKEDVEKAEEKLEHSKKWAAVQRLHNALGDKKATKEDLKTAMKDAIRYFGGVIED